QRDAGVMLAGADSHSGVLSATGAKTFVPASIPAWKTTRTTWRRQWNRPSPLHIRLHGHRRQRHEARDQIVRLAGIVARLAQAEADLDQFGKLVGVFPVVE